jgi:hypothetical protein
MKQPLQHPAPTPPPPPMSERLDYAIVAGYIYNLARGVA